MYPFIFMHIWESHWPNLCTTLMLAIVKWDWTVKRKTANLHKSLFGENGVDLPSPKRFRSDRQPVKDIWEKLRRKDNYLSSSSLSRLWGYMVCSVIITVSNYLKYLSVLSGKSIYRGNTKTCTFRTL